MGNTLILIEMAKITRTTPNVVILCNNCLQIPYKAHEHRLHSIFVKQDLFDEVQKTIGALGVTKVACTQKERKVMNTKRPPSLLT